jgi:low molecular weight phosphotyrosine protein phosphatase
MAEAVFAHLVDELGLKGRVGKVDSCGTGAYHQGEKADSRCVWTQKRRGGGGC